MRNIELKNHLYLVIAMSALAWFSLAYMNGLNLSEARDFFGLIPQVVSFDLFVILVFVKWGWKLKIFKGWLVPFPNLNGTWVGFVNSRWINPEDGKRLPSVPVMLTIRQSFFHISFVLRSSEMESASYSEGFLLDADRQIRKIAYSYTSKPRILLSDRSHAHDGAAILDIIQQPQLRLKGKYWTDRLSTGEIDLKFQSEKILEVLPDNFGVHPLAKGDGKS